MDKDASNITVRKEVVDKIAANSNDIIANDSVKKIQETQEKRDSHNDNENMEEVSKSPNNLENSGFWITQQEVSHEKDVADNNLLSTPTDKESNQQNEQVRYQ